MRAIWPGDAPSAMRTPISRVRWATRNDRTPYSPIAASSRPKKRQTGDQHGQEPGPLAQAVHLGLDGFDGDGQRGIDGRHLPAHPAFQCARIERRFEHCDGAQARRARPVHAQQVIFRLRRIGEARILHVPGHAHHRQPTGRRRRGPICWPTGFSAGNMRPARDWLRISGSLGCGALLFVEIASG
jgi:hypothetical protein